MYGLVNLAVKDLVVNSFGADKWERVKELAGYDHDTFERMSPYPDELTYKLVAAVCEVLGLTTEQALIAFGEYWVLYTGREGYGHLFDIAGSNLLDFLSNLDALHTRIGTNFPHLVPPSFQCETIDANTLRMHYHTDRKGLCPMVKGLLQGLAKHFKCELELEHPICRITGAEHCEFIVRVKPAAVASA